MAKYVSLSLVLFFGFCSLILYMGCSNRKKGGQATKREKGQKLSDGVLIQHQGDQLRYVYEVLGDEFTSIDDIESAFLNAADGDKIEDLSLISPSGWLQRWTLESNGTSSKLISPLFVAQGISYFYEVYLSTDGVGKMELKRERLLRSSGASHFDNL